MAAAETIQCPLCSFEYSTTGDACHPGCPLAKHCHWLCCPHCGYRMVDEAHSKAGHWLQKLWPVRGRATPASAQSTAADALPRSDAHAGAISFAEVPTGTSVTITGFTAAAPQHMARFAVLGLTPGARAELVQRHPAPIVRIDETELALSKELLAKIRVRLTP